MTRPLMTDEVMAWLRQQVPLYGDPDLCITAFLDAIETVELQP